MYKNNVIIGAPSEELLTLEREGKLVLCELKHLQGKSEAEIEEALQKEPAVWLYKHICIDASTLPEEYFERIWYRHKGEPVVIKETERLLIRESIPGDAESFKLLYEDEDVRRFLEVPSVEDYKAYIEQYAKNQYEFYEYGMWSVVEKGSGKVIGRMGLELQEISTGDEKIALGYALLPKYRGFGYAYEACMAILEYCKACGYATEVFVKIDDENVTSSGLFQRLSKQNVIIINKV